MISFIRLTRQAADTSILETMLSSADKRPAREQLNEAYAHGGGWNPMDGWELLSGGYHIQYGLGEPDMDPPLPALAVGKLRDELILVYPYDWVAIVQPDNSFEIARMT